MQTVLCKHCRTVPLRPTDVPLWHSSSFASVSVLPCCTACRTLVSQPGIELGPQQWKHWILTTGASVVCDSATSWTAAHQAPLSMEFSRQRILEWVAISLLQGIFPTQASNPGLLHCRLIPYHLSRQGSPLTTGPQGNSSGTLVFKGQ